MKPANLLSAMGAALLLTQMGCNAPSQRPPMRLLPGPSGLVEVRILAKGVE